MAGLLFRDPTLKWLMRAFVSLFALLAVLIVSVALLDANRLRGPLAHFIAKRTGREIRIDGTLTAHLLSFTPRVTAERVAIGNPPWMPAGPTADIGSLALTFELLPLFRHSFVIDRLDLNGATLHFARAADGRANWQAHDPRERIGEGPPLIHSLSISKAHVLLDDERRHLKFDGIVSARDATAASGQQPLRIEGEGDLNGHPTSFSIDGDPLINVRRGQPYHFAFDERSSGSHLSGHGALPRPFDFHSLDTAFDAQGQDLKDLYFLTGVTLPNTGPYRLSGKLVRKGTHFQFSDLIASAGHSDMQGSLSIEIASGRPKLDLDLHSQLLRLSDLGARAAGRAPPPKANPLLLSDTALRLVGIRRSDGVVNFHAAVLEVGSVSLHQVAAQMAIDHGVATVTPLSATFVSGGRISGRVKFDANPNVPSADADLRVTDLHLDQFARKGSGEPPLDGVLQARLIIAGHGSSLHEIGSNANGSVTAVLPHGGVRASFAELTGIDVSRALGLMLTKDRKETPVRCGIASFKIHDGTLSGETVLVDTESVLITGKGTIHLDSEALDLSVRGRPKSLRLIRVRSPVLVRGTLAHPSVGLEMRHSALQVGEAVALGVILTPVAAILAFVDPGLAKDADCAALIAGAKADGASAPRAAH